MTGRQDDRQEYDRQRTLDEYMIDMWQSLYELSLYGTEFIRDKVYTGQSLYRDKVYTGQSLYRDKVYTRTKFIRGKVYTGQSSYSDKVYTRTKFIQLFSYCTGY